MSQWSSKNWTSEDLRLFRIEHGISRMYVCTHLKCYERAAMVDAMFLHIDNAERTVASLLATQDEHNLMRAKLYELHKAMFLDAKDFNNKELETYVSELAKILST